MLRSLHQRATQTVLREFHFSQSASEVIIPSSAWPDRFRWNATAPHTETPLLLCTREGIQRAQDTCVALLQTYCKDIAGAPLSEAAVWLGFAFHLVQDLAAHEGRTKNEHALQVLLFWQNPDYQPTVYRTALRYTRAFLKFLQCTLPQERWQALRNFVQPLSQEHRFRLLGRPDFRWTSLLHFILDGIGYIFDRSPYKRVRWDTDSVLERCRVTPR